MFELTMFGNSHRYLISYTAYGGHSNEFEIQGKDCRVISDRELTGPEIAAEVAYHIQEQDGIPVSQVVLHKIGQLVN
jgi:orotate phosphoribosyltransferase-like protein